MARLADLLCQSVSEDERFGSAWYVKFAFELGTDIPRAQKLFGMYGVGYIYSANGLVLSDTPRNRRKMAVLYGSCVVINERGSMWKRTTADIGTLNRKRAKIADIRKQHAIERAEREWREEKRRERFFTNMQTKACPKHQGRANAHSDIGKYVNNPYRRAGIYEASPVKRKVYAVISF